MSKALIAINMNQSNVRFLDLPNEVLFIILKKLDNTDVRYSLLGVDNQRLGMIVKEKKFTCRLSILHWQCHLMMLCQLRPQCTIDSALIYCQELVKILNLLFLNQNL